MENKFDIRILQLFSIFENPNRVQNLNIKISFSYSKQYSLWAVTQIDLKVQRKKYDHKNFNFISDTKLIH